MKRLGPSQAKLDGKIVKAEDMKIELVTDHTCSLKVKSSLIDTYNGLLALNIDDEEF